MSAPAEAIRILVASDNADDARQVRAALVDDFGSSVEVSTQADQAVADFERLLPGIVVLAYDTLEKAQGYCLGLFRLSKTAAAHHHLTIILCSGAELRTAFELCKKGYFDDYVLYWPHSHDGTRLAMSVWNARRHLIESQPSPELAAALAHVESARRLGSAVDRQLTAGMDHIGAAHASLARAEHLPGAAPVLAAARTAIAPMSAWADGFRAEVEPHVAGLRVAVGPSRPGQPEILLVEDDAFSAALTVKALELAGCRIEVASNAPAALAALRRTRPSAILMDVNLPGMDGLALTEWLKASPSCSAIPVLMLTADARRETIERSRTAGAAGFLVKPFTREALIAKIGALLDPVRQRPEPEARVA